MVRQTLVGSEGLFAKVAVELLGLRIPIISLCSIPSVHALFSFTVRHHCSVPRMITLALFRIYFSSIISCPVPFFVMPLLCLLILLVSKLYHLLLDWLWSWGCL